MEKSVFSESKRETLLEVFEEAQSTSFVKKEIEW